MVTFCPLRVPCKTCRHVIACNLHSPRVNQMQNWFSVDSNFNHTVAMWRTKFFGFRKRDNDKSSHKCGYNSIKAFFFFMDDETLHATQSWIEILRDSDCLRLLCAKWEKTQSNLFINAFHLRSWVSHGRSWAGVHCIFYFLLINLLVQWFVGCCFFFLQNFLFAIVAKRIYYARGILSGIDVLMESS